MATTLIHMVSLLFTQSLLLPLHLPPQATPDAQITRMVGFTILGAGVAWIGLRMQLTRAAQLQSRGADLERLFLTAVLILAAFPLCQWLLTINNAMAIYFNALTNLQHMNSLTGGVTADLAILTAASGGTAILMAGLWAFVSIAILVLLAIVAVFYFIREAEIIFFAVSMPIWAAMYAFDETAGVFPAAMAELCTAIFVQTVQSIMVWLMFSVILSQVPENVPQAINNLFLTMALAYLLTRVPFYLHQLFTSRVAAGHPFLNQITDVVIMGSRVAPFL